MAGATGVAGAASAGATFNDVLLVADAPVVAGWLVVADVPAADVLVVADVPVADVLVVADALVVEGEVAA
ncbi:hypothetical protein MZC64_24555 [Crossiella sp. S99.2]|nr:MULTISPECIES: hypothetical protein [unclassified Crossiella]MCK2241030.1 hypothetical protein [Crossiella sp. S99.2]MCK2253826.1 hypothetical protein [Crossiella sp. S99.1]